MFGMITMLVQYVGLFMSGLHTGILLGILLLVLLQQWYIIPSIWIVIGILTALSILFAILNLYFQKALTILGTALYGSAIMTTCVDYFVNKFSTVLWICDVVQIKGSLLGHMCWYQIIILSMWPCLVLTSIIIQWRWTGRGIHHQESKYPT